MTILFAGGQDTSFTLIGAAVGNSASSGLRFRATYSQGSVSGSSNTGTTDPPTNRFQTPTFTSGSVVWIHARFDATGGAGITNQQGILVRSPDGISRIVVRQASTTEGQLKISTRNSAGTLTDLATATANFTVNTNTGFDMKIDYSVSGGVQLWLDGVQVINFSGDPRTDAATQLNQIDFAALDNGSAFWSEIIIADEDTRSMALWTLNPQAAGNTQSWTPNTLANVNKSVINDATMVSTSTNNALSQWTTPTSPPSGTWGVKAIVQEARVQVGVSGPQHFDWSLRTASTDFTAGTSNAPSTSFGSFGNQIWATNPNTSGAWVIGDIAAGFNLGIKALA